jgi:hypothetical protein
MMNTNSAMFSRCTNTTVVERLPGAPQNKENQSEELCRAKNSSQPDLSLAHVTALQR